MNWEEIRTEYETTEISLADLAEKHGIKYPTIKSRKQRQGWSKDASTQKDVSSVKKRAGPPKGSRNAAGHGAPKGNQNAKGNRGGPGGPFKNDHAVTHGFFRKYLPEDTAEIMEQLESRAPIDILWDNIMIQYTAIIRAQRIMFVTDRDDKTIERIEEKGGNVWGEKWEVQQAWDKQATFLSAQSRAMSTLQGMLKQYEDMCRQDQADEEHSLRLKKLQAEVDNLAGGGKNGDSEDWITALKQAAERRKARVSGDG